MNEWRMVSGGRGGEEERGRYLHARREQGVGVGGGTQARRGIGQEVPISIFLAARTQQQGGVDHCCKTGHSAAPKLAGVQACQTGVGPRDQDRSHLQKAAVVGCWWWYPNHPGRQVALYSTWGRVPMNAASKAARHHTSSQAHRHTLSHPHSHPHTARQRWSVRAVPIHETRRPLGQRP